MAEQQAKIDEWVAEHAPEILVERQRRMRQERMLRDERLYQWSLAAATSVRGDRMRQELLTVQEREEAGPGSAYGEASGSGSAYGETSGSEVVMFACPSERTFDPSEDPWEAAMAADVGGGLNHFLTEEELGGGIEQQGEGQGSSTVPTGAVRGHLPGTQAQDQTRAQ